MDSLENQFAPADRWKLRKVRHDDHEGSVAHFENSAHNQTEDAIIE